VSEQERDVNLDSEEKKSIADMSSEELGKTLFSWRDYTPLPLVVLFLFFATPSVTSVTIGMLMIFIGELIRLYSVSFIGAVSRTRSDSTGDKLVIDGAFAFVRNPLYVGNFFLAMGFAVYTGVNGLILITALAFAFQYYFIVQYEESILRGKFGEEYERYCQTVPAWIPSRLPALEEWQWPVSFAPAIRSERRTFMAIGVMLLALLILA